MHISIFELFSIGIGPSSSHTVGPMRAAATFLDDLRNAGLLDSTARLRADLFGSLGLTGKGHGTDTAVILGFEGELPETVDPSGVSDRLERIAAEKQLNMAGERMISFTQKNDLVFNRREVMRAHPNGMRFRAYDSDGQELLAEAFYSIGGGFIIREHEMAQELEARAAAEVPYPFDTADELIGHCNQHGISTSDVMYANECALCHSKFPYHETMRTKVPCYQT